MAVFNISQFIWMFEKSNKTTRINQGSFSGQMLLLGVDF